jgi:hypothetical protein
MYEKVTTQSHWYDTGTIREEKNGYGDHTGRKKRIREEKNGYGKKKTDTGRKGRIRAGYGDYTGTIREEKNGYGDYTGTIRGLYGDYTGRAYGKGVREGRTGRAYGKGVREGPCNKKAVFYARGWAGGRGVKPDAKQHHGAHIHGFESERPQQARRKLKPSKHKLSQQA